MCACLAVLATSFLRASPAVAADNAHTLVGQYDINGVPKVTTCTDLLQFTHSLQGWLGFEGSTQCTTGNLTFSGQATVHSGLTSSGPTVATGTSASPGPSGSTFSGGAYGSQNDPVTSTYVARYDVAITLPDTPQARWVSYPLTCAVYGRTAYCNISTLPEARDTDVLPGTTGADLSTDESGPLIPSDVLSLLQTDGQLDVNALLPAFNVAHQSVTKSSGGQSEASACEFWVTAKRAGTRAEAYFGINCTVAATLEGVFSWIDVNTGQTFKAARRGPVNGRSGYMWADTTYKGHAGYRKLQWCGQASTWYGATGSCVMINGTV
jgi:hypothetical protein